MERPEIIKLSKKNIQIHNLEKAKNILEKKYEISYGKYDSQELKKAIKNKNPFFMENNFIIGYNENGNFISSDNEEIPIERMIKAIIVESEKEEDEEIAKKTGDPFAIIGKNQWTDPLDGFNIISDLKIDEIFLPPHSAIFNFLIPSEKEIKEKIVSCLNGININIFSKDNYIDNCIHEIGHLFWRDCVKFEEKKKFEDYFKILKPSAIYEYEWERSGPEEMFCTIYKWYVKSILINKSFYNILEFEESAGLKMLQDVMDRKAQDKISHDIWELNKKEVLNYLNPALDKTTGKRIVKTGTFENIKDIELPDDLLNNVERFEDGIMYIDLNKAIVPVKGNKIYWRKIKDNE